MQHRSTGPSSAGLHGRLRKEGAVWDFGTNPVGTRWKSIANMEFCMSCDTYLTVMQVMVAGAIVDRSALTYTRGYVFPWRSKVRYGVLRTATLFVGTEVDT